MSEIISRFKALRIIPVAVLERTTDAMPLADALVAGGLPCIEIVLRSSKAIDAIHMTSLRKDILVGAGTVLTIDQVKAAMDAGARFVVSPGFNPKTAEYCVQHQIVHIPGVCTPTEIEAALELGLRVLKFFPAEACGGVNTLTAISSPYSQVAFIPTGGIHNGNLARYLQLSSVLACGGTWIAKSELIRSGRFDSILNITRNAVAIANDGVPTD